MKLKINIILIGIIMAVSVLAVGCQAEQSDILHTEDIKTPTISIEPVITPQITPKEPPKPANPKGSSIFKNTGDLGTFENLSKLSQEQIDLINSFDYESQYYRLKNEPIGMSIEYLSFWETGFFVDYVNLDTEEFYNFKWIGVSEPEEYLESINDHIENSDELSYNDVIVKGGIEYYIHRFTFEECAVTEADIFYRGEIRWIEDGECFYLGVRSLQMIDEDTLQYCQAVKYELP